MANRNFNRFQALEKEVKSLYAEISIGASGAPTLVAGLGIASVVRDSAGVYTITLQDKYNRLMHAHVQVLSAAAQDLDVQLQSEDVEGTKEVVIRCQAVAVETDPSSGSVLFVRLDLKNSSV